MIRIRIQKELLAGSGKMILDVDLEIKEGEFITLYGESGAGKTSILRMIGGLMKPDTGFIQVSDAVFFDSNQKLNLTPQKRKVGYLFQEYALFPNMTVYENIRYAGGDHEAIMELLQLLGIESLRDVYPGQLSGGQQQRVALGRAIIQKPRILLLDEPLSALDQKTRYNLQKYIRELHERYRLTTILVSHDHSEMIRLSDKVFMIEGGKITREGKPTELLVNDQISGKFQLTGTIVKIEVQAFISILFISTGNDIVKVISDNKNEHFEVGDKVLVASKAFNPLISKI